MATEQLTIEVNYKDYGAQKKVDALTKSFEALNNVTSGKGFTQLNNVAKSLASLGQSLSGISGAGSSLREVAKSASALSTAFKSFDSKSIRGLDRVANALNSINIQNKSLDAVSKLANGLSRLTSVAKDSDLSQNLQKVAKEVAAFAQSVVNNISPETLSRFERLGAAMAWLSSGPGKSFNTSNMSSGAKIASKIFSDLGNNIKKVIKLGWELGKLPFKMILSPLQKIGQGIMGMTNRFTTFLKGIGRIALYRAIRTGIKLVTQSVREGVNNLYIWASMVGNSFQPTMDSLATSFLYLKNSIGAMVSPLLDALAPALEIVVDQIVDVLNIFNQVIATMTGATTWRKALRAPASYADNISGLGHDAEDAADSVKELKRTILGFDEINKLEDKTKTLVPKNNGKDATGYYAKQGAFSFEEVPITKTALDISKMLKDAWNKADFTEIGDIAAKKIAGILNNIDWKKVNSFTEKFAKSLGTFLNGLLDYNGKGGKALWDAVAKTIYEGINNAILGYTTFFDTVNWKGIGNGIGAAIKRVCENINWTEGDNSLGDALAAFPNAVIDVLTGFTEKFTAKDFYKLGNNIGGVVTKALTKIKWKDLFNATIDISTGILSAFNGLLEGLGWAQIKDSILTGIKAVPKEKWAKLGTEIGKAIFSVADFVANMADMLIKAVEAGKWKDLVKGIWTGLDKKVKDKYGSWAGAAKELGSWIVNHMGTISTLVAIVASFSLAKGIGAALWNTVKSGLIGAGGSVKGGTWRGLISTIAITAGISLLFSNWNGKSAKSKIAAAIGGGLATAGIVAKATACTFTGALLAFGVGAAITLSLKHLYDTAKECGITSKKFLTDLAADIIGLGVGFILGGPIGAALGLTLATILTLGIEKLNIDTSKVGGIGSQFSFGDANGTGDTSFAGSAGWSRDNKDNLVTSKQDRRYGAPNKNSSINIGTITATLDKNTASNAWTQLTKDWSTITKLNKVKEFMTKGLVNKASDWWTSAKKFWSDTIKGKTAKQFTIAGIVNKAGTWWSEVKQYWKDKITDKTASRFTIAGIFNKAGTWWTDVKTYWKERIDGKTASKFTVGGVYNKARSWWSDVKGYWSDVTSGKSLKASVTINNTYNVFAAAFNAIQTNFNKHPIVATVTTKTVKQASYNPKTKTVGGYTVDKNGAVNLPTPKAANGGVYKNGQWHDVTAFASGGMPGNSGQVFLAREAGPELVGTIGGNTAVLNNDQIVASVSAGVAQAVASVLGGGNTNEITINVDSETLYRAVRKGERMASGRYGTAIAIG